MLKLVLVNKKEAKELDTRMKLIRNREELDQLLQNVPNILKQNAERKSCRSE